MQVTRWMIQGSLALLILHSSVLPADNGKKTVVDRVCISGSSGNEEAILDPFLLTLKLNQELIKTGRLNITERPRAFSDLYTPQTSEDARNSDRDALRIVESAENQQVVKGHIRYFGDKAWVTIALFDAESETRITEVGVSCDNTQRNIVDHVIPDLAQKLVGLNAASLVPPQPRTIPLVKAKPGYLKWGFLGIVVASSAVLLGKVAFQSENAVSPAVDNVEMVLRW